MSEAAETREYTIDELTAHTRVPSRTIRYYQSKGVLPNPEVRGRKAFYGEAHVERLGQIAMLQDRGLQIKAIRDLMWRIDRGELVLDDWLGLEDRIQARWGDDGPALLAEGELKERVGAGRVGVIAELTRLGVIERQGDAWLVPSPTLLRSFLTMEAAGIDLRVAKAAADIARRHLGRMADELAEHYARHAGEGFGASTAPGDLAEAFDAARPLGQVVVHTILGQEMERAMRDLVKSGRAAKVTAKKR